MQKNFTVEQFNRLLEPQKYDLLENYGTYLDTYRHVDGYKVALFAIFQYYCEVWLSEKTDTLYKATAFKSYKKLDTYLDKIDLSVVYALL